MAEENGAPKEYPAEIKEIGDKIVALRVSEAVLLADYLEHEHGIKPAAGAVGVAVGPSTGPEPETDDEPTEFNVILAGLADTSAKIKVIKVVRELTGAGLKDAKELVEGAPKAVKEGVQKDEADTIKSKLEEAGAKVEVKPA